MRLLIILLVLGARRLDSGWPVWLTRDDRHQRLLAALAPHRHGVLGWWLSVALPAVLVALFFGWLHGFWGALLTLVLGSVLMLWLVGVESEFRPVDELLVRGRMNDREALLACARESFGHPEAEPDKAWFSGLGECVLERAAGLFAVIFWITVLGFGAALLFMLNRAWLARHPDHCDWSRSLDAAMSWIPNRLSALALALVGHFGAVMHVLGGRIWRLDDGASLLGQAARAALGEEGRSAETGFQAGVDLLEALQGLLLRALAVWLIFAALWTLLAV